jgi:hypothetical protein
MLMKILLNTFECAGSAPENRLPPSLVFATSPRTRLSVVLDSSCLKDVETPNQWQPSLHVRRHLWRECGRCGGFHALLGQRDLKLIAGRGGFGFRDDVRDSVLAALSDASREKPHFFNAAYNFALADS